MQTEIDAKTHLVEVAGNDIDIENVMRYLPSNFVAVNQTTNAYDDTVVIVVGYDSHGWTYESYVKPRLASGNMFASCKLGEHDH